METDRMGTTKPQLQFVRIPEFVLLYGVKIIIPVNI